MRAAAATATTAPIDPATWFPAPLNWDGVGDMVLVGELEFPLMLLTMRDGQGAVAEGAYAAVRVTMTSGAGPVGQDVPHAARTVDYLCVSNTPSHPDLWDESYHALRVGTESSHESEGSDGELHRGIE